jgi:osmotically-inducible protein OsmY
MSQELRQRVIAALMANNLPHYKQINVDENNGIVRLTGTVLTYYEKQVCNSCVKRVIGIQQLINDLVVGSEPSQVSTSY